MKLHENTTLFRQAIIATAESMQIPEIYIEKDYWVSYALQRIFADRIGAETIFKGGTALSKCFGLIERFSEDIDLVVVRQDSDSGNQLKAKIKRIGAVVSEHLPEVEVPGLSRRMGMNRKTAHAYPREFTGNYG
jgi:predicted nucleotidyltransferase component of viral defense system